MLIEGADLLRSLKCCGGEAAAARCAATLDLSNLMGEVAVSRGSILPGVTDRESICSKIQMLSAYTVFDEKND